MRRPTCAHVISLVLALSADPAAAEIYRWTDAQGREHFTSDPSQVPPGQRDGAEQSLGTLNRAESAPQPPAASPAQQAPGGPAAPAPAGETIGGRDEAGWRKSAEELRSAIARLEGEVAACKPSAVVRLGAGANRRAWVEEQAEAERCDRTGSDLQARRLQLERLEQNAHRLGVPPGWLR